MVVALLGGGVMGESILRGLLAAGTDPGDVVLVERRADRARELADAYGVAAVDPAEAAEQADVLLLAVKPQDVAAALTEVAAHVRPGSVVVSVAAGISTYRLEGLLPAGTAVVRAMPNTPALVGAGLTAVCAGAHAGDEHLSRAERLLGAVGQVVLVAEHQMDAVTAVSGSGPAYVFLVVEALVEAGVRAGLPRDLSTRLVVGTLRGSAAMLTETGEHPAVLRERVTSPGGTTAAALHVLEQRGLRAAFLDAVLANRDRARELGGE
jgi:pyrroline-5-carboxylate reductase